MAKKHSVNDVLALEKGWKISLRITLCTDTPHTGHMCVVCCLCVEAQATGPRKVSFITLHQPPASETSESQLGWLLASPRSTCSHLLARICIRHSTHIFHVFWGSRLWSSCLHNKHLLYPLVHPTYGRVQVGYECLSIISAYLKGAPKSRDFTEVVGRPEHTT